MIDNPCRLEETSFRFQIFSFKENRSIFKFVQALTGKVGINRSCEHKQLVLWKFFFNLKIIYVESDSNVVIVEQHLFKHCCVPISWKSLEVIIKVFIILVSSVR